MSRDVLVIRVDELREVLAQFSGDEEITIAAAPVGLGGGAWDLVTQIREWRFIMADEEEHARWKRGQ